MIFFIFVFYLSKPHATHPYMSIYMKSLNYFLMPFRSVKNMFNKYPVVIYR